jgi:hypothetical protein
MTPQPYSIFTAHQRNPENDIVLQIIKLFELFPGLSGFSVGRSEDAGHDADGDDGTLAIRNVSFGESARREDESEVRHRIHDLLMQFVEGRPELVELLSGRTFSRTLHQLLDTRALHAQQRA